MSSQGYLLFLMVADPAVFWEVSPSTASAGLRRNEGGGAERWGASSLFQGSAFYPPCQPWLLRLPYCLSPLSFLYLALGMGGVREAGL